MVEAATVLNNDDEKERFAAVLKQAISSYHKRLWNGRVFDTSYCCGLRNH